MSERSIALTAAREHPAYPGHFPGAPIVPGVVLLDWIIAAIETAERCRVLPGRLPVIKFLSPVAPGAALTLHYRFEAADRIDFRVAAGNRAVASGTLSAGAAR